MKKRTRGQARNERSERLLSEATDSALLPTTVRLLSESSERLEEIAASTGIGHEWLRKLKKGYIPNPGVIRVQALHDYLASRVLS